MMEHEDLGKTKLDHVLSYIVIYFTKGLEWLLIVLSPLAIVEQTAIYGTTHPDQVISLLIVLTLIISAYGYKLFRDWRRNNEKQ